MFNSKKTLFNPLIKILLEILERVFEFELIFEFVDKIILNVFQY